MALKPTLKVIPREESKHIKNLVEHQFDSFPCAVLIEQEMWDLVQNATVDMEQVGLFRHLTLSYNT